MCVVVHRNGDTFYAALDTIIPTGSKQVPVHDYQFYRLRLPGLQRREAAYYLRLVTETSVTSSSSRNAAQLKF